MDGSFKKKPALQKSGRNRATKPHGAGRNGTDLFQREADLSGNRPAKETFSGKRILLAQLEDPGALFGEVYAFMGKSSYDMYVETLTQTSVLIMSSRIFTDREENSLSRKLRENLLEVFDGKAYNMNQKL